MPMITVASSVPADQIPVEFCSLLTDLLAAMLQKPRERVVVHLMSDQRVRVGNSDEPSVVASLSSIGKIGADFNQEHLNQLCSFFRKHLNVSPKNTVVRFVDLIPINVAWNGQLRDK
uniref:L-dopachrome isomerase n=1 Tax=Trichuris muris TaxID=70415 RepID=A0A5S6QT59_TRIMR